jgi:hypothetical protein
MKSSNSKSHEISNACHTDTYYPGNDSNGYFTLLQSNDVNENMIQRLIHVHDLMVSIKKFHTLPFDMQKDLHGIKLLKRSPLADQFYNVVNVPNAGLPPKHIASELGKTFQEIWNKIGLSTVNLSGNPLSVIAAGGLTEGELVNAFFQRANEATKRKTYIAAVALQSSKLAQSNRSFKRYLDRHLAIKPNLHVMRIELQLPSALAGDMVVQQSSKQVQDFFTALTNDLYTPVRGYWWKREYRTEIGYSHHVVLLSDGQKIFNEQHLVQNLTNCWQSVTNGLGLLFQQGYDSCNYRSWGVGSMSNSWNNTRQQLLDSVSLMLARDQYICLAPVQSIEHVGMGVLPMPMKKVAKGSQHGNAPQPFFFSQPYIAGQKF